MNKKPTHKAKKPVNAKRVAGSMIHIVGVPLDLLKRIEARQSTTGATKRAIVLQALEAFV
jgi:hypothetical protein